MITAATPPLPPAVYQAAVKPNPADEAVWTWTTIVPASLPACDPRVLCPVVQETALNGWPHQVTEPERLAIAHAVMARFLPTTGALVCRWPDGTAGRARCGVVSRVHGRVRARFRVDVRVWEDGAYRLTRGRAS